MNRLHPIENVGLWRSLGARFHGMEEVVGSIPTRSTNIPFRDIGLRHLHFSCDSFAGAEGC